MKYLIIEDEQLAAVEMQRLLKVIEPAAEIVGILPSVKKSEEWLKGNPQPNLIFMDIHLQDGLCFEIFDKMEIRVPVIFTTAYDQYALKAFQSNGVAYLLKPIDEDELRDALKRISSFSEEKQKASVEETAKTLMNRTETDYMQRLSLKTGDTYISLPIENVAYFYSEDHYTFVCSKDNKRYIINSSLDDLDGRLDPNRFFRAARNCTVSIEAVGKVSKFFNGRLKLHTLPDFNSDLYVSRNKVKEFITWLGDN
ncbi:MAG: LytTR family DNA-binding domain-containing protein [Paludibacteraceae bacterium]|nr:LytTR family DNA-binding domain-containing protein [Paludibacteraceae bacterium]